LLLKDLTPYSSFIKQMKSGCDMIMSISFNTFLGIVSFKPVVFYHRVVKRLVHWHFFFSREKSGGFSFLDLLVPGVDSDVFYFVPFFWVCFENALDHAFAVA